MFTVVHVITVESSEAVDLTATADSSIAAEQPGIYRCSGNRACHINVGGTATQDVDLYLAAGEVVYLSVGADESISAVQANGETDGLLFVTRIRET